MTDTWPRECWFDVCGLAKSTHVFCPDDECDLASGVRSYPQPRSTVAMTRFVKYTPAFARATRLGLAIRAVDAAEMGACELQGPHPDSDLPLHYAEAIDPRTGRNWMDSPKTEYLPGTSPRYVMIASPILTAHWNVMPADTRASALGYRPNEWYFVPESAITEAGEVPVWPDVWDASVAQPEAVPPVETAVSLGGNANGAVPSEILLVPSSTRLPIWSAAERRAALVKRVEKIDIAIKACLEANVYPTDLREELGAALVELRELNSVIPVAPAVPNLDALVDRFLTWPVPADVRPDGIAGAAGRTGTNLLTATQAREMLAHVLGAEVP